MQVNFTGLSNPTYLLIKNNSNNETVHMFSSILNDDINGTDYTNFKNALHKNDIPMISYINPINLKMVSIAINKAKDEHYGYTYKFRLNGEVLPINRNTMPIFDFLAKMTRTIANTPEDKIIKNRDYVDSDEIRYGLFPGIDMEKLLNNSGTEAEEMFNIIRGSQNAIRGAGIVNKNIHNAMVDYLA